MISVVLPPEDVYLGVTELTFDNAKRMPHLGSQTGLKFLGLFCELTPRRALLHFALARKAGNIPIYVSGLRSVTNPLVARISKDRLFFTVQQRRALA